MTIYQKTHALVCSLSLLLFAAISAHAADATFSWTANTDPVSGYKIHYGTSSRDYNSVIDVGLPTVVNGGIVASVEGLQEGITYYFAATAYNATDESDYSDEVVYAVPGAATPTPPVANSAAFSVAGDSSYSGTLSADDLDGDTLTYSLPSQGTNGIATITAKWFVHLHTE